MKKKQKIAIIAVIAIVMVSLLMCAIYVFRQNDSNNNEQQEFNQERWNEYPFKRYTMIKDLNNKYDLESMNRDEILDLLGKNSAVISETSIRYDTGGGYFKDEILQFIFDKAGKVKDIGIAN